MRKFVAFAVIAAELYGAARWWRGNRRVGADVVNRVIDPWVERRGLISGSGGQLGLIEHVGRKSGIVRQTPVHPMPTPDGFRIIVPIGDRSEWARNVLAAGHCRLVLGGQQVELDEPVFEMPTDVPGVPRPLRALFRWLGFRYLRLRSVIAPRNAVVVPAFETAPV